MFRTVESRSPGMGERRIIVPGRSRGLAETLPRDPSENNDVLVNADFDGVSCCA